MAKKAVTHKLGAVIAAYPDGRRVYACETCGQTHTLKPHAVKAA